jgi:hypothetical protein
MFDDAIERATERELEAAIDPNPVGTSAGQAILVKFVELPGVTYPASSPGVFSCRIADAKFPEEEGATVTMADRTGSLAWVANVTDIVPAPNQYWIAHQIADRIVTAYTGKAKT